MKKIYLFIAAIAFLAGTFTSCKKDEEKTAATYTVKFDAVSGQFSDGKSTRDVSVASGEKVSKPEDPTLDGAIFENWYSDATLTTVYDFSTAVTKNFTLYAKYTAAAGSFKVTFNAMDGQFAGGAKTKDTIVVSGDQVSKPEDPTISLYGYIFEGWCSDSTLTTAYDFKTAVTQSITLYARYKANEGNMTLKEQSAYLMQQGGIGEAILNEIDAKDFQKLADMLVDYRNHLHVYDPEGRFDELINHYKDTVFKSEDPTKVYIKIKASQILEDITITPLADTTKQDIFYKHKDNAPLTVTINKNDSLRHTYSLEATVTDSDKLIELFTNKGTQDTTYYLYAPTRLVATLKVDNVEYMKLDLNFDVSSFAGKDIDKIIGEFMRAGGLRDLIKALEPLLHFAIGGDIYVNGLSSYKIQLDNLKIDLPYISTDLTLCGRSASSILSGSLSLDGTKLLEAIEKDEDYTNNEIRDLFIEAVKALELTSPKSNTAELVWNRDEKGYLELLLNGYANPQLWIIPKEIDFSGTREQINERLLDSAYIHTADSVYPLVSIAELLGVHWGENIDILIDQIGKLVVDFKEVFKDVIKEKDDEDDD